LIVGQSVAFRAAQIEPKLIRSTRLATQINDTLHWRITFKSVRKSNQFSELPGDRGRHHGITTRLRRTSRAIGFNRGRCSLEAFDPIWPANALNLTIAAEVESLEITGGRFYGQKRPKWDNQR